MYIELKIAGLKGAPEIPAKNRANTVMFFKKKMWQVFERQSNF